MDEKNLDKYIEKISEFIIKKNTSPDHDELKVIAIEAGFDDSDVAAFEQDLMKKKALAFGFLRHGLVEEADKILSELKQIFSQDSSLDELETEILGQRAKQHPSIFKMQLIKKRLNFLVSADPSNERALAILSSLSRKNNRRLPLIILTASFGLIAVFVIAFGTKTEGTKSRPETASDTVVSDKNLKEFTTEFIGEGFEFSVLSAEVHDYDKSFSVRVTATLRHLQMEISDLEMSYEFLLGKGTVYKQIQRKLSIGGSKLIPGDELPVSALLYEDGKKNPGIKKCRITVTGMKGVKALVSDYPAIDLDYDLASYTGPQLQFKIALRSQRPSKGGNILYNYTYLSLINDGQRPVSHLRLEAFWVDDQGKEVCSKSVYVVQKSDAPVMPKASRGFFVFPSWDPALNVNSQDIHLRILELE